MKKIIQLFLLSLSMFINFQPNINAQDNIGVQDLRVTHSSVEAERLRAEIAKLRAEMHRQGRTIRELDSRLDSLQSLMKGPDSLAEAQAALRYAAEAENKHLNWSASSAGLPSGNSAVDRMIERRAVSNKVINIDPDAAERSEVRRNAETDSLRRLITLYYYDQFRHFQDPDAPYFLFMSKGAGLTMGIGGCVRFRGYYDWGGAIPISGFAPYLIPMVKDPQSMRQFGTTPAGSTIYFRVVGSNKLLANYQIYIEGNFNGYNGLGFELKKAYAIINDFTVGYAASTFSDPSALPPTVDAQGPNNKFSATSTLIRYMPTVKNRWVFAVSAETPASARATYTDYTRSVRNWIPDVAAFAQYQWARGQHVRIAGIARTLSYLNTLDTKRHDIVGWGLQLSSVAHPWSPVTTYATLSYGHGYSGLGGDLQIGAYDMTADPLINGKMYAPASLGWCVGVQYNFLPNLFISASASQSHYMPSHTVAPEEYKWGLASDINIFWNPTPRIQVAAEFDYGIRRNVSGATGHARRIGALAQFAF